MTEKEQKQAAKQFAEFWKDKGYEKLLISDYRLKEQTNISQRKINTIISIYNYYHIPLLRTVSTGHSDIRNLKI